MHMIFRCCLSRTHAVNKHSTLIAHRTHVADGDDRRNSRNVVIHVEEILLMSESIQLNKASPIIGVDTVDEKNEAAESKTMAISKPTEKMKRKHSRKKEQPQRPKFKVAPATRYGYLIAIEPTEGRRNGYTLWRCRCDCGNEYLAASRELKNKKMPSCKDPSCEYYRESVRISHNAEDFTGRRYGKLIVLGPSTALVPGDLRHPVQPEQTIQPENPKNPEQNTTTVSVRVKPKPRGNILWICKCDCGNSVVASSTELKTGNRKSCGCLSHPPLKDWIGRQFGMLTVTSYAGKKNGVHFWKCRCECGNETTVNQSSLKSGHTTSCGCQAKPVYEYKTLVDGTCVELLRTALKKGTIAKNNTSGVRGVYWDKKRQNWVAQITFKGKTLYLGSFANIGEAATARKRAEKRYFGEFLEEYDSKTAGTGPTGS